MYTHVMTDSCIAAALSELDPSEYEAAWRYVALLERLSEISRVEAEAWRSAIYERVDVAGAITNDVDLMH